MLSYYIKSQFDKVFNPKLITQIPLFDTFSRLNIIHLKHDFFFRILLPLASIIHPYFSSYLKLIFHGKIQVTSN